MAQPSPQSIPRRLYRWARTRRETREEARFSSQIRFDAGAPELLLSPHWDDAVLDCWGLLADDRELRVVNIFAGVPAAGRLTLWDAMTGASDSADRAKERIAEDAMAMSRAGREAFNLSFLDGQYRRPPQPQLTEIDAAVSGCAPSASRVYAPAGIGGHPDHVLTRRYGRMLARAGMPVTLYAELPYCVNHGWPEWVDGRDPDPHRNVDAYWTSFLEGLPELPPLRSARVLRLDPGAAADKLAAMRCYTSQFSCLDYGARGLLSDPAIHGFEVSWELGANAAANDEPQRAEELTGGRMT
jgi:LmbE family N-acetylglucosaminyl deacetylase